TPYASRTNPTFLFAKESTTRALNLDDASASSSQITLDLSTTAAPLEMSASLSWAPYQYVDGAWQNYDTEEYLKGLESRLGQDSFFQAADSSDTSQQEAAGKLI